MRNGGIMGFLGSGIFWGLVLVLIGLSIIVRVVFNIDIPVFKIIIGLLLIYLGLQVLFGPSFRMFKRSSRVNRVFNRSSRLFNEYSKPKNINEITEYNIVFDSGSINLTQQNTDKKVTVNVVFGSAIILIDPETFFEIENNTVFGETSYPGKTISFFGIEKFDFGPTNNVRNKINLELNTVFSSVRIEKNG